jgi:hypothetical protein
VTATVPACRESEPQNHTVLAGNGRTYQVTSYELETRNRSRWVLLSILQCFDKFHLDTSERRGSGVPRIRTAKSHLLARNGATYQATSYELETKNPSRWVLLRILQCDPTSFIRAQATGTVLGRSPSVFNDPAHHSVYAPLSCRRLASPCNRPYFGKSDGRRR